MEEQRGPQRGENRGSGCEGWTESWETPDGGSWRGREPPDEEGEGPPGGRGCWGGRAGKRPAAGEPGAAPGGAGLGGSQRRARGAAWVPELGLNSKVQWSCDSFHLDVTSHGVSRGGRNLDGSLVSLEGAPGRRWHYLPAARVQPAASGASAQRENARALPTEARAVLLRRWGLCPPRRRKRGRSPTAPPVHEL